MAQVPSWPQEPHRDRLTSRMEGIEAMSQSDYTLFECGLLQRHAFTDGDTFDKEMRQIFARVWLFVGHESQVPNPGDFVASRMGPEHVLLTRSTSGEICVLLNTCRHKGMRVCRYDEGNLARFKCPYHAWTYANNGSLEHQSGDLIAVQAYKEGYDGRLDKDQWGLLRARVALYRGAVFATWADDAPDLEEYLGTYARYLDVLLQAQDGSEGGTEVVAGVLKWRLRSNWKVCYENFSADGLHNVSHSSTEAVGIGPGGVGVTRHGQASTTITGLQEYSSPAWGHGCMHSGPHLLTEDNYDFFPHFVAPVGPQDDPAACEQHYREVARRRLERLGGTVDVAGPLIVGGVFPNLSFHTTFPRTIAVWHPIAPGVTEGWRWCLVDRAAPPAVKAMVRHHFMRYSGPVGMTESDDTENWSYLTEGTRTTLADRIPFNYQARLGYERTVAELPDQTTTDSFYTEEGPRTFYRAWQRHLNSRDWSEYLRRTASELSPSSEAPL